VEAPRTHAAFEQRVAEGRGRLAVELAYLAGIAAEVAAELDGVRAALAPLGGKPGLARAVVDDVRGQLAHVAPPDLIAVTPLARLDHVVRYLKAIRVRLQRQAHDPQKDHSKAQQVVPIWQAFVAGRDALRAKGRSEAELADFGWLVEELRVQVFAPELKTAIAVSPARAQELWSALQRR
jgi:ATP-dependent helicase HrpA